MKQHSKLQHSEFSNIHVSYKAKLAMKQQVSKIQVSYEARFKLAMKQQVSKIQVSYEAAS